MKITIQCFYTAFHESLILDSPPLLLSLSSYCCCSCAPSSRPSRRSEPRLRSRSALLTNQRWAPRSRDPLSANHSSPALPVPVVALAVVQRLTRGPELSVKLLLHLQSLDLFPQHLQHCTLSLQDFDFLALMIQKLWLSNCKVGPIIVSDTVYCFP